jgi:prevent-host-death family protein
MTTLNDYIGEERNRKMKTMSISDFKTHALKSIDTVYTTKERILITKRGNPVAEVIPYESPDEKPVPGKLAHALVAEKDIVSPLGPKMWDSCR